MNVLAPQAKIDTLILYLQSLSRPQMLFTLEVKCKIRRFDDFVLRFTD